MLQKDLPIVFSRLGFTKHAAGVYAIVGRRGPLLATDIIHTTAIHRPAVYRALRELLRAKLITTKKTGKRTYYVSEGRQRVSAHFIKDLERLGEVKKSRLTPEIETVNSSLQIFRGPKGIRTVFDDVIDHTPKRETFYRYTSEVDLEAVNRYLSPNYRKRRDKKKLERLVISNPASEQKKRPRLERFIKRIPASIPFEQNIIQIVYGQRLAFIDLNKEEAMIIENAALADFQKVIFKQLYNKL